MDALRAEISAKRKTLQDDPPAAVPARKYIRRGELDRLKEQEEREARQAKERQVEEAESALTSVTSKVCLFF
jgi:pre-mRNA-splicing factor 18